jgi:UDP-3-O-[3-hydroxymyristoyl] N-acetylglucosamine deacetylase
VVVGVGIHSGKRCRVRLHRAEGPLRFRRGAAEIPARVESVVSTERCVVLSEKAARVATVEHLLAALSAAGHWTGVVVEADAEELPILDGSALPWDEEIERLGAPEAAPEPLSTADPVRFRSGESVAELLPGPPRLDVSVDFPHPAIGRQSWSGGPESWHEVLGARTFGFLAELDSLRTAGLASGAGTENAIVFDDSGPLGPLRYVDEPVRHKALDLLGDLALLGRPLHATVRVERGSHRLHLNLMHSYLQSRPWMATAG